MQIPLTAWIDLGRLSGMRKLWLTLIFLGILYFPQQAHVASRWIASGGLGLTFSPTLLLVSPRLEYIHKANLYYGPLVQLGVGDATLLTGSATLRLRVGKHPKLKPTIEGGLGIAAASSAFSSSVGLHIMLGMGADYIVDRFLSIGTIVRLNFAPPLKTFFASWPLVVARFRI